MSELLGPDRVQRRREHLMSEITADPQPNAGRSRRRRTVIATVLASVTIAGAGVAYAVSSAIIPNPHGGVPAVDSSKLRPVYHGEYVTKDQVTDLQSHGKAMGEIDTIETACQGIALYFDTEAETDVYGHAYMARLAALPKSAPGADPCAVWKNDASLVAAK